MTINEGDIIKTVLEYVVPGSSQALNVFHWVYGGIEKEDTLVVSDLVEWATDDWGDDWAALADNNTQLSNMILQQVDNVGLVLRDIGSAFLNIDGAAVSGSVMPAANSAYIQADTATPGVQGRKYIPGATEEQVEQGIFGPGAIVTMGFLLLDWITTFTPTSGGSYFPGVISSKLLDFELFQASGLIEDVPAYQRRRKPGVGS